MSVVLTMHRHLPGPIDLVWRLLTDWEHQDDWMLEMDDVQVVSEHRDGVGVEAEASVKIGGITTRDRIRVTGWEPPHLLEIEHLGWVTGRGEMRMTPQGNGTLLIWTEELNAPLGRLGAVGIRIFKPFMRRIFERDIRVLESMVRAANEA